VSALGHVLQWAAPQQQDPLTLATGEPVAYDILVFATGARARKLPIPGADLKGVLELRTAADAEQLKAALGPDRRLAIIGGGYVGLEAAASARALGAHHTHNYRTDPAWAKAVKRATNGLGAEFVMEVGGAGTLQESLKSVRIGGHVAIIGIVSGAGEPLQTGWLISTSARMQGVSVGSRSMFEAMCRAIELHRIEPVVDQSFHFTEAVAAFESMRAGAHFGKIVLTF
jgi:D-arabinose 1-dehydrogenase-like Zn-dependent alcohol dehydrogenase